MVLGLMVTGRFPMKTVRGIAASFSSPVDFLASAAAAFLSFFWGRVSTWAGPSLSLSTSLSSSSSSSSSESLSSSAALRFFPLLPAAAAPLEATAADADFFFFPGAPPPAITAAAASYASSTLAFSSAFLDSCCCFACKPLSDAAAGACLPPSPSLASLSESLPESAPAPRSAASRVRRPPLLLEPPAAAAFAPFVPPFARPLAVRCLSASRCAEAGGGAASTLVAAANAFPVEKSPPASLALSPTMPSNIPMLVVAVAPPTVT
mmetsp:Transcript_37544/g.92921  ORF Transcript_37544/g.92921 Transcript_37544/m.92921 type:complete len:264 (+) Transcript_37544:347-1138(+)